MGDILFLCLGSEISCKGIIIILNLVIIAFGDRFRVNTVWKYSCNTVESETTCNI